VLNAMSLTSINCINSAEKMGVENIFDERWNLE
jgi:hypothetical protein